MDLTELAIKGEPWVSVAETRTTGKQCSHVELDMRSLRQSVMVRFKPTDSENVPHPMAMSTCSDINCPEKLA